MHCTIIAIGLAQIIMLISMKISTCISASCLSSRLGFVITPFYRVGEPHRQNVLMSGTQSLGIFVPDNLTDAISIINRLRHRHQRKLLSAWVKNLVLCSCCLSTEHAPHHVRRGDRIRTYDPLLPKQML